MGWSEQFTHYAAYVVQILETFSTEFNYKAEIVWVWCLNLKSALIPLCALGQ